ncbi:MAG: type II toxin-antitoxin system HipA family toxin [Chitinophagaceae bacterium]
MSASKTDILVYAHWKGIHFPERIGILTAQQVKTRKAFSFTYDTAWMVSHKGLLLDPDIMPFAGAQFPVKKENFGIFLDAMPDTWGRTLMKRRAAQEATEEGHKAIVLHDLDFLLRVQDISRMGGLRFKLQPDGTFLDDDPQPVPPWAIVRELQRASGMIESNKNTLEVRKWLAILLAPGSSLGGARPKANILDENGQLWIAKFPSANDSIDKGAWEFLTWRLAVSVGISMAECRLQKVAGKFHTFFTKRFDREKTERIHFASAMTMTGKNEAFIKENVPSYLDIAEFIQFSCPQADEYLRQLWRRMIFNIAISNTDGHLRNHGFILKDNQWHLSPAFDMNPSIDKSGLALNIDMDNNALDYDLAKSVGKYFRLNEKEMYKIMNEVKTKVAGWKKIAKEIGISRAEQELMGPAFRV